MNWLEMVFEGFDDYIVELLSKNVRASLDFLMQEEKIP